MSKFKEIEFTNDYRYLVAHNPSEEDPNKVQVFLLTNIGYIKDGGSHGVTQMVDKMNKVTQQRFQEVYDLLDADEIEAAKEKARSIKKDLHPFNDPDLTGIFTTIFLS